MDRIEEMLARYKSWCEKLGIVTAGDINRIIDEGKTDTLINLSEIWHEQNISEIAEKIRDDIREKRIVMISGPSSSGKTSFAKKLQLHLRVLGINAVSISMDDYYIESEKMPKNPDGTPDYEALQSIDYMRFNRDMELLTIGETAVMPRMDFETGVINQTATTLKLEKDEIIIVEGIHGLNDKIISNIDSERKYKIYCSALTALSTDDGKRIKSRTTRFIRRLIRDYKFRNSSCKNTFMLWPGVEEGARKNIFPYTDTADVIFNSSLLYELAVYKSFLNEVFDKSECDEKDSGEIAALRGLLENFHEIPARSTPHSSIIREFIGGSTIL